MATKNITDENFNEKAALDFETQRSYLIDRSNKRAWRVAFTSLIVTVLLIIAIVFMLPLKRVDLVVVKVDKNGFVEIITQLDEQVVSTTEAIDKHFIAKYVKTREQYYFETLNQDFETVQMYSSPIVSKSYINFMLDEINGRATVLKDKKEISVKILSIVLSNKNDENIATVRIEVIEKGKNSNNTNEDKKIKVITLTYDYLSIKQTASLRLENPLGFRINTYRKDEGITE